MNDPSPHRPRHTQTTRRLKYGLNVTVAIVAAVALAVLVNWLAFRHMPRWDMTGTGRYTLAAQTRQVLDQLEADHQIVTLFRTTNTQLERVRDLVDEYDRHSPRLSVRHIDPDRDIVARGRFYERLRQRFDAQLEPAAAAIDAGRVRLIEVMSELPQMLPELRAVAEHPELTNQQVRQTVQAILSTVGRFDTQLEAVNEALDESLEAALPDFGQAHAVLESALTELDERLLAIAIDRFDRVADQRGVPNEAKETLLVINDRWLRPARATAARGLEALGDVEVPGRYEQLRRELRGTEAVVVLGPERVQVIPALELQRQVDPQLARAGGGEPELQFLGEERITGALVSMQLAQPPMVVFVSLGSTPALGERGRYMQVAERLAGANFQIERWTPRGAGAGGMGQMQGMAGGGDTQPPRPAPGQPVVWVLLPAEGQDPMMAMMGGDGVDDEVVEHVRHRMAEAGDGALVMLTIDAADAAAVPGPMTRWLRTWGVRPGVDRVLMRETGPTQRARAELQLEVTRWPGGLAVTEAVAGMRGLFMQASPLELMVGRAGGDGMAVEHWPLVRVTGDRLWAEPVVNLRSADALRNARYNPESGAEAFTVGVAAESRDRDEQAMRRRLVVVADAAWATDTITTAGQLGGQIAPGLAEMFGAAFPANSELFVNSVYWLAGLDEMIAASPRTQDIRRIRAMSDTRMRFYQITLLLGVPALVLAAGLGVWFVRRRG